MSIPTMPAGQLKVLLHHYTTSSSYPEPCAIHGEFVENLVNNELLDWHPERQTFEDNDVVITARGRAYVEMLLSTPLPVQRWVDPREAA